MKITEQQLRNVISETIKNVLNESYNSMDAAYDYMWGPGSDERFGDDKKVKERTGHLYNLFFDKYLAKQNRQEMMSGKEYYVFTGTTRLGYERHWCGTEEELNDEVSFYHLSNVGKIAGPFSYRKAAHDYCQRKKINTPQPGQSVEAEWSPEKKAEQARIREEHKYFGKLINAATTAMANIANPQMQRKSGLLAPPAKIRINKYEVAKQMKRYVREPELINKIDSFLKDGKEPLINKAILSAYEGVKIQLASIQQGANGIQGDGYFYEN